MAVAVLDTAAAAGVAPPPSADPVVGFPGTMLAAEIAGRGMEMAGAGITGRAAGGGGGPLAGGGGRGPLGAGGGAEGGPPGENGEEEEEAGDEDGVAVLLFPSLAPAFRRDTKGLGAGGGGGAPPPREAILDRYLPPLSIHSALHLHLPRSTLGAQMVAPCICVCLCMEMDAYTCT